jgi:hypothetical protein
MLPSKDGETVRIVHIVGEPSPVYDPIVVRKRASSECRDPEPSLTTIDTIATSKISGRPPRPRHRHVANSTSIDTTTTT